MSSYVGNVRARILGVIAVRFSTYKVWTNKTPKSSQLNRGPYYLSGIIIIKPLNQKININHRGGCTNFFRLSEGNNRIRRTYLQLGDVGRDWGQLRGGHFTPNQSGGFPT